MVAIVAGQKSDRDWIYGTAAAAVVVVLYGFYIVLRRRRMGAKRLAK
jgi:uncharacterized protein (TIGR03382 family)